MGTFTLPPVLHIEGLSKSFAGTQALNSVDLHIRAGEVHAVIGQNGSGKSTLVKILAGFHQPDRVARAEVGGRPVQLGDASSARAVGWRFVHQDLGLVLALDTVDNLAIGYGYITGKGYRIRWRDEMAAARRAIAELGYRFNVRKPLDQLAVVERTAVAIARALQDLGEGTRLLVLDEPTAAMPRPEVERLLVLVQRIRQRGIAVLYISHHLDEVLEIADRITVLRDGKVVGTQPVELVNRHDLIKMMTGVRPAALKMAQSHVLSSSLEPLLEVNAVSGEALQGFSAEICAGEVVGVAGITGSGRDELGALLFGGRPRTGIVRVAGRVVPPSRPDKAVAQGIGYVPADRQSLGLVMSMTIRENITLPDVSRYWRHARLQHNAERREVTRLQANLSVKRTRGEVAVSALSGGNQQKVSLGKWIRLKSNVLLLDEPTQGVDVGSQADIHGLIRDLASEGAAILVCSSDESELESLCDRVIVLRRGRIAAELRGSQLSSAEITRASLEGKVLSEETE